MTYFIPFSSACVVDFKQVNVSWLIFVVGVELVPQQIQYRLITSKNNFFSDISALPYYNFMSGVQQRVPSRHLAAQSQQ